MRAAQGLNETVGPVYVLLMKPPSLFKDEKNENSFFIQVPNPENDSQSQSQSV